MSPRKKGGGLTGRVRASITQFIRDEVRRRPHCCITWNLYGTPEGTLVVSYLCLNHDSHWKDTFEVAVDVTQSDSQQTTDSRCPRLGSQDAPSHQARATPEAPPEAVDIDTLDMFGTEGGGTPPSTESKEE